MPIRKVEVAQGIWWIEVPEADLRLLCGCPADSVKHLIKRGLIVSQELAGVRCETGPNAILLSDLTLQNGEFSNLAEFPVLQMLYKQGMMLPGHPGNTGRKPLLIGRASQLAAQMRYIYRGNYGLVSKEEIMAAGIPEERAEAMMRVKLAFAFGRIRPTADFLDGLVLGHGPAEIRGGVTIRRLETNVFEIAYGGGRVTVDLNLRPGGQYEAAYPLGFRTYQDNYFSVIHSGEGDGWDAHRPTMSSIITYQGRLYLIDAGPNVAHILTALGIGINQIDGIFHTHAHDDHFAGLTTLLKAGRKIQYFATPLVRHSVAKKLAALLDMEEERFGEYFEVCDLEFDRWNDVEGLEVKPVYSPHPVETNLLFFRTLWGDGWRSYAHFADIASFDVLERMITEDGSAPGLSRALFEAVRADYLAPADVKKIDIGGGLIHGAALDFRDDPSGRLLLAHRAGEQTLEEKEIGSSAAFGTTEILVAAQTDGLRRQAFSYLQAYLPGVPLHHLRTLLNHPIEDINPGALIHKEGETPPDVVLVLSGGVERISTRAKVYGTLSAGSLIGAGRALADRPGANTYRALSFVQAMRIPAPLFARIVQCNGLTERTQQAAELRTFLESTRLFAEGVPSVVLSRFVDGAEVQVLPAGGDIPSRAMEKLNIIRRGRVHRLVGGVLSEVLRERDYFGEEQAVFRFPCLFHLEVMEETELLQIPGDMLGDVPMARWLLFEGYTQRVGNIVYAGNGTGNFAWREDFSIQVDQMDIHHKRLVEIANAVLETLENPADRLALFQAFGSLVTYSRYHFAAEDELMRRYGYPQAADHILQHERLIAMVSDYSDRLLDGKIPGREDFSRFFQSWLIDHILSEDRKYALFLNGKGIF